LTVLNTTSPTLPAAGAGNARAERRPVVFSRNGEVFANSRDVAEFFGKGHRNVLQAIDNLLSEEASIPPLTFQQGSYTTPSTGAQQHRHFDMTRDGFTLLAMGFTGTKALRWKIRYIEAFNAMDAELRRKDAEAKIDVTATLSNPAILRQLLVAYTGKVIGLQGEVAELRPAAQALERIAISDGSMSVTEAAKTLQVGPKELFTHLRRDGWIYRRPGSASDLAYQAKLTAGLLEHKTTTVVRNDGTEKTVTQVRVTPKGLTRLAKDLGQVGA
jgi:Rha family phage regulatory protein